MGEQAGTVAARQPAAIAAHPSFDSTGCPRTARFYRVTCRSTYRVTY
ncbi:hypothetical protein [Paenibacillus tepidiphilus]|nr:hypothetical protein [Paenibacillus tepidiphilus]